MPEIVEHDMEEKTKVNMQCGAACNGMCAAAREYTAQLSGIASQFIGDGDARSRHTEGAAKEICDALLAELGISPNEAQICVDVKALESKDGCGTVLCDAIGGNGILIRSAKKCKDNGILPYHIAAILAHGLLMDSENDERAAAIQAYVCGHGLKSAIIKYCGLEHDPELVQLIADQYGKIQQGCIEDQEKIALMKSAYHIGFNSEKTYKGCAQCTLLTMFQLFGRRSDTLFQSASALAAGMALSGDGACGGYSGGIMYMGTIIGRRLEHLEDGDKAAKEMSYRMAQMLRYRFLSTYGSVICADVHTQIFGQPYCLRTQEVKNAFEQAGAHTTKCTAVIGTVSAWLAEIIYDCGYAPVQDEVCG